MQDLRIRLVSGTALAMIALAATPATAQVAVAAADAPVVQASAAPADQAQAADDGDRIPDIVVTGRKRARNEELQDVPLSVSAFGEAQLSQPVIVNLVDIGRSTPNASLQSSSQRGVQNFSIRGMGISGTTPSDEPAVGVFQDGVYWGSNYGALADLFDLEGVEVLRGPQGTLFGRNVTGGAIAIRSARPTMAPSGRVSIGIGNGDMFEASGVANGALIGDTVAGRIAVQARTSDGLFHDTIRNSRYGGSTSYIVRPSIKFEPSSNFDVTLLGEYFTEYGDPTVVRGITPHTVGTVVSLPEREGYVTPRDYYSVFPGDRGFSDIDVYLGMVEANLKIGPGVLTSITGYRKVRARVRTDFDGTPSRGFLQGIANDQHQFSSELRYAANLSDWFDFTSGLYYFKQKFDFRENRRLNNDLSILATHSFLDNESYAAFAEADIKPFAAFTITVGGRYTHETKDAIAAPFGACTFDYVTCTFGPERNYKANNFTPKVGLSYKIADNALLFGSVTRGFRSGGFSLRGTVLIEPYTAETVTAYEAGFKTDFLDRRLRFNASVYYNKYTDLQRTVLGVSPTQGVVQAVFNAANANIKGGEVEIVAIPVRGLTLSANYGYTDASYDTFLGVADPKSREFVRVPKHTLNGAIDYTTKLGNGDSITGRVSASYTSRYFYDDPNTLSQKPYTLIDATLAYTLKDGLSLAVYGKNLTQTNYAVWGSTLGALGENRFPGNPRTYGVRMTANF